MGAVIKKFLLVLVLLISGLPSYSSYNIEQPSSNGFIADEKASPSDWIKEEQILVYDNKVIINIKGAEWARFTDTNSMDPVIDEGANAIEIIPTNYKEIGRGDIISYEIDEVDGTIIHRVIRIGNDEQGWYVITKGDNLEQADPYKIRFKNIRRVVVAIIY